MKCGWRSQQCMTPKKAIQPILGNRKERIQASGLGHTKNMPLKNLLQEGHLSPQRPPPGLSQLPLLPQEPGKVVHGGERLWVIRTEVRFAPCKSSAVQGPPPGISEMGTIWGPRRCHTFIQHAPIYTIGLICIHLQEFTRKI